MPLWYGKFRDSVERTYNQHWKLDECGGALEADDPDNVLYLEDLSEYCKKFLGGDQPMFMKNAEERLLLLLNFHCIGRGGEPKFLQWTGPTGARWGGKLGCLVLLWREVKNINSYWLTVIANAFSYKGCTLHAFAVFAAAGGLGRLDMSAADCDAMFPRLKHLNPPSVSSKISKLGPAGSTTKSLRYGSVTTLHLHPGIHHSDLTVRSGHKPVEDRSGSYMKPNIAASIPSGMGLAGYGNVRERVYYPQLPRAMLSKLSEYLDKLFWITIDEFKAKGKLAPFVEAMLASLVQYFNAMAADNLNMTNSPVIKKLVEAVMHVESLGDVDAMAKLRSWSTEVQADFTAKNVLAIGCASSTPDITAFMKTASECMTSLYTKVGQLVEEVARLNYQLQSVTDDLQSVRVKVDGVSSPPTKRRKHSQGGEEGGATSREETSKPLKVLAVRDFSFFSTDSTRDGSKSGKGTKNTDSTRDGSKSGKGTKKEWPPVPEFLETLATSNRLASMGDTAYDFASEQAKIKTTMKYLAEVITEGELNVLKLHGEGETENDKLTSLKSLCRAIYLRARDDILQKVEACGNGKPRNLDTAWTILSMHAWILKTKPIAEKSPKKAAGKKRKKETEKKNETEQKAKDVEDLEDGGNDDGADDDVDVEKGVASKTMAPASQGFLTGMGFSGGGGGGGVGIKLKGLKDGVQFWR